ncbi:MULTISPECIES: ribosome biogenesis GTPase YqeH [unclassified Gemella]|uniref:ribosome biogenesis GTPase YqeH n=1 Tax=unclassified Gemella TaxID=2624949 RepID=UPI001C04F55A|nr:MULTISPECIES: ribosome biogenesis GTPase YqeH [unclassified Gemella]MBU0278651.1 ribosome biogenesis GTPase YqeH [Gemella sp. zg-1178]QWQ39207.1 ribosome biogenesis GTPase YqeH [Gemella sp. zg-570]
MLEKITCIGCGSQIQTEDSKKQGYLPKNVLEKSIDNEIICKRCFRLKHHNEVTDVELGAEDFYELIKTLAKKDALIVKVVDIFDFSGSWIEDVTEIVGKDKDIVLVANKMDLLPKSVKENKIKQWLFKMMKQKGIKVKDIILISAIKNNGIEELASKLDILRNKKDIYIVGATNVGKSTLINKLIELTSGDKNIITTSHFPGTTLGMIEIPLDKETSIYDTPGIILDYDIAHYLDEKTLKLVIPKKEVKPRVFQLNSKQTIYFAGLCRIDFTKGDRQSFTIYASNQIDLHRTKLENADNLFEKHLGEMLAPPFKDNLSIFSETIKKSFKIQNKKTDIVISGLGWITVNSDLGCEIDIVLPKEIEVFTRDSII